MSNTVEVQAFFNAIYDNDAKLVSKYILKGIKIEQIYEKKHSFSPLVWATFLQREEIVILLLKKGADPKTKDKSGKNAYDVAKAKKFSKLLKLFEKVQDQNKSQNVQIMDSKVSIESKTTKITKTPTKTTQKIILSTSTRTTQPKLNTIKSPSKSISQTKCVESQKSIPTSSQSMIFRNSYHNLNEDLTKYSSYDLLKDRNGELQKNEEILKHDHIVLKKQLEALKLKEDERRKENLLLKNKITDLKEQLDKKEAECMKLKSKSFHGSTLDIIATVPKKDQIKIQNQILQIKCQEQSDVIELFSNQYMVDMIVEEKDQSKLNLCYQYQIPLHGLNFIDFENKMEIMKELGGILSTRQLYEKLKNEKFLNQIEIGRLINTIEKVFELWKLGLLDDENASILDDEAIECSIDNHSFAQIYHGQIIEKSITLYKSKELPVLLNKQVVSERMKILNENPEMDDEKLLNLPKEIITSIIEKWMSGELSFHLDISSILFLMKAEKKEFLKSLKNNEMEFEKVLPGLFGEQLKLKNLLSQN